jgi:Tfp pilus assembly protein PilX
MMHYIKKIISGSVVQRGFTLLIAVILTSVVLSVGLALLDVSVKQITLAAASRQSQYAFYNADSALECALYRDSIDTFDYSSEPTSGTFSCEGVSIPYTAPSAVGNTRTTTFTIPCPGDNTSGDGNSDVTITKTSTDTTHFYANGYNTCVAASPQRVERGEEANY